MAFLKVVIVALIFPFTPTLTTLSGAASSLNTFDAVNSMCFCSHSPIMRRLCVETLPQQTFCRHLVMHERLKGGGKSLDAHHRTESSTPLERTRAFRQSNDHGRDDQNHSVLSTSSFHRQESTVYFGDEKCKPGTNVMISRNFTKAEWARPYVGSVGRLVAASVDKGIWTACFGNMTANFYVGLDGINQLAYYDECSPEHHYRLAAALVAINGNASAAKAIFEKALNIEPNNVNCLSGYGMLIHSKFHDCSKAEEYFKRALTLAPQHVDTLSNYGAVLLDEFKRDYQVCNIKVLPFQQKRLANWLKPASIDFSQLPLSCLLCSRAVTIPYQNNSEFRAGCEAAAGHRRCHRPQPHPHPLLLGPSGPGQTQSYASPPFSRTHTQRGSFWPRSNTDQLYYHQKAGLPALLGHKRH